MPWRICMISSMHDLLDDRIYWKESHSLAKSGFEVIHLGVSESCENRLSNEKIRVIGVQKRKPLVKNLILNKLLNTLFLKKNIYDELFEKAATLKADVYHLHDLQLNKIGSRLKNLSHNPKIIYDAHEPYPVTISTVENRNFLQKLFMKLVGFYVFFWELRKAGAYHLIIATEENVAHKFIKHLRNIPVRIIYNYSDLKPTQRYHSKEYDFIYCGSIRIRRGIMETLQAIKILKENGFETKILIVGWFDADSTKQKVMDFITRNQLQSNVTIKKQVPYQDIPSLYANAKIGLCPFLDYQVNRLIMPIKIFEYIVMGIPVICSNFGHIGKITSKYKTGITVDTSHPEHIAQSMKTLITNDHLYNELSTNCYSAADKFKWELMEKELIDAYNLLIENKLQ